MCGLRVNMTSLRRYPNSNRTTANIPVDLRKAFSREAVPHVLTNALGLVIYMGGIEGAIATVPSST